MAKALKIIGTIVVVVGLAVVTAGAGAGLGISLATSALGVSAGTLLAAGALIGAVGAYLELKNAPVASSQIDRLNATVNPRAFRTSVLGSTAMATDVRYQEWYGDEQQYCDMIVAVASHKIQSIDEIWLNDELAWKAIGGTQGRFQRYFFVWHVITEGGPGNTFTFDPKSSGRWNASTRLTGCAFVHMNFRTNGATKKVESPFASGVPGRMTIIGKGGMLYDPRRDSTVPGGSGPMRANDQSTWRYVTDDGVEIGENVALQILRELLGWRITNPVTGAKKLAVGAGQPANRIDLQSFIVAANQCDELVNRSTGGTEPRFRGAGVLSEGDEPKLKLDMLCASCCGRLRDTGGKLALVIMHNDLAETATDAGLNDDDVIGAFTWNPDPAIEQTPNVGRGRWTDPSSASLYQLIPYPDVAIPTLDGVERVMPMDLAWVESPSQAQRVVKQTLQRRQYARTFTAPFDIRAWKWPVGSPVPFTFKPLGFNRTLFRVAEQELGQNGACNMTLSFETEQIYAWDADDVRPVVPAAPIPYNSLNDPLVIAVSGILQAAIATSFPVGLTITASDTGSVVISDHVRRYTDGFPDVAVNGTTIASGLVAGDFRAIAYDDVDRAGGAVSYVLYASDLDARASADHPGRHYVGYVFIPTAGSPPAGGGGATPPGGYCVRVDTPILMAGGATKLAGDIVVGDMLWTRHEAYLPGSGWGVFPVEAIEIVASDDVWEATIGGKLLRATGDHLVYTGTWVKMRDLGVQIGPGDVVKMTVTGAHTYVSNGVLSHNVKDRQLFEAIP